jgi:hypothetical protein
VVELVSREINEKSLRKCEKKNMYTREKIERNIKNVWIQ